MERAEDKLSIEVATWHPVGFVAARRLAQAWRRAGGTARIVPPGIVGEGAVEEGRVRLELGSLVRPSVVVTFPQPYDAPVAEALALTTAAWDALDGGEPWRDLTAPLAALPRWGQPDPSRPWLVSLAPAPRGGPRQRGEDGRGQHHVLGALPTRAGRDAVWWPRLAAAAVLGRAAMVLGDDDPLVHDAIRAGVPVADAQIAPGRLAGLVPPSLLGFDPLWLEVAAMVRHGRPEPLMTSEWIARGRRRLRERQAAPRGPTEQLRRRYLKLQRDPHRFLADSRFAALRTLGRWVAPR